MFLGKYNIDDVLTFPANTHTPATGAATDADSVPAYRVYEDETGTAILTGSMAKLDDSNTTGFYSEQITLSAANGFENGKSYTIYISAAVGAVTGTMSHSFSVGLQKVDSVAISGDSAAADTLEGYLDANIFPASINQIYGDTDAAQNLLAMFLGSFISSQVDDASPSTTDFNGDALLSSTDDFYNDMYLTFTSGTLKGISRRIVDYTGSSRNFVFTGEAWPATPEDEATFIIIARNG